MKITSVELRPANSSNIADLSFRDPRRQNPYNVKAIVGLDVDEVIPRYYRGAGGSDSYYNLSLEKRNIILRIALNPNFGDDETPSSLRDALYRFISSSRTGLIELWFKDGATVVATISGLITKFEAPHFQREPEVQITIKCDEPMLKAPTETVVDVSGLSTTLATITDNLSTSPHGFSFELAVLSDVAGLLIENPDENWYFEVNPLSGFDTGDVIHFSSEYNNKYLYMVRASVEIFLGDRITLGSVWPVIFPGDNDFAIATPASFDWNAISYYATYWGV